MTENDGDRPEPAARSMRATSPDLARGRILILIAAVLWSTSGWFAKSPIFADWPVTVDGWAVRGPLLAFWRALFASLILFVLIRRPRWTIKLIPAVLIFAAMNFTFLTSMTTTTAANAIWLQYTAPAWVFLFAWLALGEPAQRRDWWLLGFGVAGVAVIVVFESQTHGWQGITYGLLSGVTYAGVLVSLRWLRAEDAAWIIALNHLVTAALFFPYVWSCGIWPTGEQTAYLMAFGMLQMGTPYWLFARGVRAVASQEASGIVLLEPVLVPVWVYLAWHGHPGYEQPDWWTFAGGGLILCGLLLRYLSRAKAADSRSVDDQDAGSEAEDRNRQGEIAERGSEPA